MPSALPRHHPNPNPNPNPNADPNPNPNPHPHPNPTFHTRTTALFFTPELLAPLVHGAGLHVESMRYDRRLAVNRATQERMYPNLLLLLGLGLGLGLATAPRRSACTLTLTLTLTQP